MGEDLSQEEIDALLKGQRSDGEPGTRPVAPVQSFKRPGFESLGALPAPGPKAPNIRPVVYEELSGGAPVEVPVVGMEVLLDVPLSISVELGRARCFVKDLLNLSAGSVVELDKPAGDAVDILVNGKLFARGEVVVIDENFGVRIQEIVRRPVGEKSFRK